MADKDELTDILNGLIENCKDGEYGFRECAAYASSMALQRLFWARAEECRAAAEDLQIVVLGHDAVPEAGGSALGGLHRSWISLRAALRPGNDRGLLEECENGEAVALSRYREALEHDMPLGLRKLLERQLAGVRRNHEQIHALRESPATV